jgi:hypothetical protein
MQTQTITIAYINPPKQPGGKRGSVKSTDRELFGVPIEMLDQFIPGETFLVEFNETQWQGRPFKSITRVLDQPRATEPASATPLDTASEADTAPAPSAQHNSTAFTRNGSTYRATDPVDARRMFVCSLMNALITSRQVKPDAQSIAETITMLCKAYDATLGEK